MPSPHRCPNCGEKVMPLAAGCSLCGADLDLNRYARPTPWERMRRLMPTSYGIGARIATPAGIFFVLLGFVLVLFVF